MLAVPRGRYPCSTRGYNETDRDEGLELQWVPDGRSRTGNWEREKDTELGLVI